jgi:hypothetical protein
MNNIQLLSMVVSYHDFGNNGVNVYLCLFQCIIEGSHFIFLPSMPKYSFHMGTSGSSWKWVWHVTEFEEKMVILCWNRGPSTTIILKLQTLRCLWELVRWTCSSGPLANFFSQLSYFLDWLECYYFPTLSQTSFSCFECKQGSNTLCHRYHISLKVLKEQPFEKPRATKREVSHVETLAPTSLLMRASPDTLQYPS